MKKTVSFDQIKETGFSGLDGAIAVAFPGCSDIQKDGMQCLPFGTVEVDGVAWDWILKHQRYEFIEAM